MPRGTPKINSRTEELLDAPRPEVVGTIHTQNPSSGLRIDPNETPPPWEIDPKSQLRTTDARRFVEVPSNWELRWINPRLIDHYGWRDWQPVMASDPRVVVKVRQLISPEGNIRRGGPGGDILGWMYKSWVESRKQQKQERLDKLTQSAIERTQATQESLNRGDFGPYIRGAGSIHPTHTHADGRTME